jgi:hypothetical protein
MIPWESHAESPPTRFAVGTSPVGETGSRGITCEQFCNIFAKIVPDEYIEEHPDIGNEDRNY